MLSGFESWIAFLNCTSQGKSGHQLPVLIDIQYNCLVSIFRPLKPAAPVKAEGIHRHADSFKANPLNPITSAAPKQVDRPFFKRVEVEVKPHKSSQAVNSFSQVGFASADNNFRKAVSIFKHTIFSIGPGRLSSRRTGKAFE